MNRCTVHRPAESCRNQRRASTGLASASGRRLAERGDARLRMTDDGSSPGDNVARFLSSTRDNDERGGEKEAGRATDLTSRVEKSLEGFAMS